MLRLFEYFQRIQHKYAGDIKFANTQNKKSEKCSSFPPHDCLENDSSVFWMSVDMVYVMVT
jgi:hypothetical protein